MFVVFFSTVPDRTFALMADTNVHIGPKNLTANYHYCVTKWIALQRLHKFNDFLFLPLPEVH